MAKRWTWSPENRERSQATIARRVARFDATVVDIIRRMRAEGAKFRKSPRRLRRPVFRRRALAGLFPFVVRPPLSPCLVSAVSVVRRRTAPAGIPNRLFGR